MSRALRAVGERVHGPADLSHAEAAIIQSCSPGTIAWRMHQAREQLRKALDRPRRITVKKTFGNDKQDISTELNELMRACGFPILA